MQSALPQPTITSRTIWVNPAIGNDNNDGSVNDAAHAMKTIAGANLRQIGIGRRPNLDGQLVTVNYVGATCAEDIFIDANLGGSGAYSIQGFPTIVHQGTFSAGHFPTSGFVAGDQLTLTDSSGTFSFAPFTADGGFRIDITSGSGVGFSCFILKNLGGGVARVTYLANWPGPGGAINTGNNQYAPTFPCTYNIVQLPHFTGAILDQTAVGFVAGQTWSSGLQLHDMWIDNLRPTQGAPVYVGCIIGFFVPEGALPTSAINVMFAGIFGLNNAGGSVGTFSGGFMSSAALGGFGQLLAGAGQVFCDEGPQFENVIIYVGGSNLPGGGAVLDIHERGGLFDLPQAALVFSAGSLVIGSSGICGQGNTTPIFQINPGGLVGVSGTPVLATTTSTAVEVVWGAGGGTQTNARPYDPVADTTAALQNSTFAALSTSLGGGGFGYNAIRQGAAFRQV